MAERLTAEASFPLQTGVLHGERRARRDAQEGRGRLERVASRDRPDLSQADLAQADLMMADLAYANLNRANLAVANFAKGDLGRADLSGADLSGAKLFEANLFEAHLIKARLTDADLTDADLMLADLSGADLSGASLMKAYLAGAKLFKANLNRAYLAGADLSGADLIDADLTDANLEGATLLETNFTGADLTACRIYGVSAWGLKLERTKQQNLVITNSLEDKPKITVDNIEVAQFIYLVLHNQKIRDVIDTITSKAVLILGRFTDDRKAVLDALREELRKRNYLPILFDFDKPTSQTTDETITLLARMSRFVIADISDAKSVLQELRAIVPDLPSVPVQPVITATQEEPGMFDFFRNFRSFLKVHHYNNHQQLIADLGERVIDPAEKWRSVREAAAGQTGSR
jgi:uncharacterized protein YjbI with pentapeptide repeats